MATQKAQYSCDLCRIRKAHCDREYAGCQRCKDADAACIYSRSGIIRRKRKRKRETMLNASARVTDLGVIEAPLTNSDSVESTLQSHLDTEINETSDRLRDLDATQHNFLSALSSLSKASAAVWHDDTDFQKKNGHGYFLFEANADSWVEVFIETLKRGKPLTMTPPPEVVGHLKACRPSHVQDRSWLVMYYSVILSMISSTSPTENLIKSRLRCNLWLALNDVRLLLEPKDSNIMALMLLAAHVEEFTTPSLCWMLTSIACRMLQALGVNQKRLNDAAREQRTIRFWHLNLLDKGSALIFGRSPTFHRAMANEIPLPKLEQLVSFQPHNTASSGPGLFGPHFCYQIMLLSRVMGDIWSAVHEDTPDNQTVERVVEQLWSWYRGAREVLDAAALVERPLLDIKSAASVDLGLRMMEFHFHYLLILMSRCSTDRRAQSITYSIEMLHQLKDLVSDSEEPFNGIIWQLLCCPFTPFLNLLGEVIAKRQLDAVRRDEYLAAMEQLPDFLERMSLRNSLAERLHRVAKLLTQQASTTISSKEWEPDGTSLTFNVQAKQSPSPAPDTFTPWDLLYHDTMNGTGFDLSEGSLPLQVGDTEFWVNFPVEEVVSGWVGWEDRS